MHDVLLHTTCRFKLAGSQHAAAEGTGANRITATRDLVQLVELGLLIPHGAGRGAAYRVPLERFLPEGAQDVIGMMDGFHASNELEREKGEE